MIMRARYVSAAAIVTSIFMTTFAWAQLNFGDADIRELSQYKLTSERVSTLTSALKALNKLAQSNPAAIRNVVAKEGSTISDSVKLIEADTAVSTAIKSAAITAHDYVLSSIALAQAYNAAELKKMGASYSGQLQVPDENVAFVESHPVAIEAVMSEIEKFAQVADSSSN